MSAYEIVWFRGRRFDRMTARALMDMEKILGYELTIMQGSYNGGVGASAGTHDGGGAVDLAGADAENKVRAGRTVGFAMWEREAWQGPWPHHVHGILYGNAKAAGAAKRQVAAYLNHRDGLVSNRWDATWRPRHIRPYRYRVQPSIAVDLSDLRLDFMQALDGDSKTFNAPARRVRRVQRRLSKVLGRPIALDGVAGPQTLRAWRQWERKNGDSTPNSLPDEVQLKALLKGSVYYMVP